MSSQTMTILANLVLFVGTFVSGAAGASSPYINGASTETVAPQELGYVTSSGSLVYSVNMCSIVHSTICQTAMSTSGAPSAPRPSAGVPSPASAYSSGKVDAATSPPEQTPTSVVRATSTITKPTTMTRGTLSDYPTTTSDDVDVTPTETEAYPPTSSTASPVPVSTGASNSVSVMRGVAIGAGAMAVAFLF